ncbi:MAG: hypothetical protein V4564_06175 [Pseudomonadota bacterium]
MIPRRAQRIDSNQAEIVAALKRAGCTVEFIGQPLDLLVGRTGKNFLLELKSDNDQPTPAQRDFLKAWNGHAAVVRSFEEALQAVGLAKPAKAA